MSRELSGSGHEGIRFRPRETKRISTSQRGRYTRSTLHRGVTEMRAILKLMVESLWPSPSSEPASRTSREVGLRLVIILMIALLAGPDVFAAMELTTLLELLGATLFLLTFAVGFRVLGRAAFDSLREFLLPAEYVSLVKMRWEPSAWIHGASFICRRGLLLGCSGLLAYAWIYALVRLVP
jgi:hypothetical protein